MYVVKVVGPLILALIFFIERGPFSSVYEVLDAVASA